MVIDFEKPVYEKIWTGDVDKILSYDPEHGSFIVEDTKTGLVRVHMTNLDVKYLSFEPDSFMGFRDGDPTIHGKIVANYLIAKGLPRRRVSS